MSLTGKTKKDTYKDLIQLDNSNSGIVSSGSASANTYNVKDGQGNTSNLSIGQDRTKIQPTYDNTAVLNVSDQDGNLLFGVDTTNDLVTANGNKVNTQVKEFGLHTFSPTQGYHHPMIANNTMFSDSGEDFIGGTHFGNSADPATTLDVSSAGIVAPNTLPCMWYVESRSILQSVRVLAQCGSSNDLNFHLYSYTLDISSNHGDLSSGILLAHIGTVISATSGTIKTNTLTIDSAIIGANQVVLAFVENEGGTGDITCQMNVKYYLA